MRRSLEDIAYMVDPTKHYRGLPEDLRPFEVYFKDAGFCVLCVPEALRAQAAKSDPDLYEVGVPTKYVLSHPYQIENGHVYIEVPFDDELGIVTDEKYDEF